MDLNDFDVTPVVSGNLVSVGFNEKTSQGYVEFKKGAYLYEGVTREEADSIINSPSANDQFTALWKTAKRYNKVA